VLEAADLVHSGIATRVAVFSDPPDAVDREFIRRGAPYEDVGARSLRQLRSLGPVALLDGVGCCEGGVPEDESLFRQAYSTAKKGGRRSRQKKAT
jgi:hypothetical protein